MRFLIGLSLSLGLAPCLHGATLSVPGEYPTIGAAVLAGASGDEVVIDPGVYYEREIIVATNLTLRSVAPGEPVTIDAGRTGNLVVINALGGTVTLRDIVLTNGTTGVFVDEAARSSVVCERCGFLNNDGIGFYYNTPPPVYPLQQVEFRDCRFNGNRSFGLWLFFGCSTTMTDCVIENNGNTGAVKLGGEFELTRVLVSGNTANGNSWGGGVGLVACDAILDDVQFLNNTGQRGGGIAIEEEGSYLLTNCTFTNCSAPIGAQAYISNVHGFPMTVRFNCCEIDTAEFAGPVWEQGLVEITDEGCGVSTGKRCWSDVKALYR